MAPRKRDPDTLTIVAEPSLTPTQFDAWCDGIELFDNGEYWHAHERWEQMWLEMGNDERDDAEIVVRGFIQLSAGLHLIDEKRLDGAHSNLLKAAAKLAFAPPIFLNVDIARLRHRVEEQIIAFPDRIPIMLAPRL